MKETRFVINVLENGWDWQDVYNEGIAEEYCCEELEIPAEYIEELKCYNDAFEVSLQKSKAYFRDDWYVNLQRVAS